MPGEVWTEGWLPVEDGYWHILLDGDPYAGNGKLFVNGEEKPITYCARLRDGGTTFITVDDEIGGMTCHRAIGREHYDSWTFPMGKPIRLLTEDPT